MNKVYLIESNINGTITYKIGKTTRSANTRLLELSTGNAGEMRVVCEFETDLADLLEIALHNHYRHIKLSGEWFKDSLTESDFLKSCQKIDENLKKLKNSENPFV